MHQELAPVFGEYVVCVGVVCVWQGVCVQDMCVAGRLCGGEVVW